MAVFLLVNNNLKLIFINSVTNITVNVIVTRAQSYSWFSSCLAKAHIYLCGFKGSFSPTMWKTPFSLVKIQRTSSFFRIN